MCRYPFQCDSRNIEKRKTPKERGYYVEEFCCISIFARSCSKPRYGYVDENIKKDIHGSDVRIVVMFRFKGLNYYQGNAEKG